MRFRRLALVLVSLLASIWHLPVSHAVVPKDFSVPAVYPLTKCASASEFDCIESVGIINEQGKLELANFISDASAESPHNYMGNTIYNGRSSWKINATQIDLRATIDSPLTNGCNGTCAALRIHIDVPLPLQTKVKIMFKTSWLRPMNVQMKALEADYTYKKIPGGSIWTMEGKGTPYSTYWANTIEELNAKKSSNAIADFDGNLFDFYIHHAGYTQKDSYWDPKCSDKGFSVQSHNTNETGDPIWDSVNESLFFSIFAPHFKMNGDLNTGYFKYWTSHEFMDCKYPGNTLTKSPKLTIEILNEDGTQNIATTAVTNKDGILYFFASGFHFSSPRIVIKAAKVAEVAPLPLPSPTPTPSPSPTQAAVFSPMKTSITCVKGKLTKKVSAVNPKCPAGYKKK